MTSASEVATIVGRYVEALEQFDLEAAADCFTDDLFYSHPPYSAQDLVDLAVAADGLGFDALWLGEHVVLPVEYATPHPTTTSHTQQHHTGPIVDVSTRLLDPWVLLGAVASVQRGTSRQGRRRSGRGSGGSPNTRSPMMLRWISSEPPATR